MSLDFTLDELECLEDALREPNGTVRDRWRSVWEKVKVELAEARRDEPSDVPLVSSALTGYTRGQQVRVNSGGEERARWEKGFILDPNRYCKVIVVKKGSFTTFEVDPDKVRDASEEQW